MRKQITLYLIPKEDFVLVQKLPAVQNEIELITIKEIFSLFARDIVSKINKIKINIIPFKIQ